MTEIYKTYKHNPPHLFRSNVKYFITGATYKKVHYMRSDEAKKLFLKYLFTSFDHYNWEIEDWVVLNNHYHLMVNAPEDAETLGQVINNVHRFASGAIDIETINIDATHIDTVDVLHTKKLNTHIDTVDVLHTKNVNTIHIKKFHNYWDTCITYENSYFTRLHYIWFNPVKHGYVDDPIKWKYGSYFYRSTKEKNEITEIIEKYPCDKVNIYDDF